MNKTEWCAIYDQVYEAVQAIGDVTEGNDNDMYVEINGVNVKITVDVAD